MGSQGIPSTWAYPVWDAWARDDFSKAPRDPGPEVCTSLTFKLLGLVPYLQMANQSAQVMSSPGNALNHVGGPLLGV